MKILAEGLQFPEGQVALGDGSVLLVEMRVGVVARISPDGERIVFGLPGFQCLDSLSLGAGGYICVAALLTGVVSVVARPTVRYCGSWSFPTA